MAWQIILIMAVRRVAGRIATGGDYFYDQKRIRRFTFRQNVGDVAGVGALVEVLELLAGVLRMLFEVEIGTLSDALQLAPTPRELIFYVGDASCIMGKFGIFVRAQP